MNKTEIRDKWEKRIAAYKTSGLSAWAWCAKALTNPCWQMLYGYCLRYDK
ncbi:hypothetical protein [Fonticella tunisiensis]|nr:hypothetical protein [Fonticella tunisiensis]